VTYATVTAVSASMPETEGCAKHSLTPHGLRSHDRLVRKTTWMCTQKQMNCPSVI